MSIVPTPPRGILPPLPLQVATADGDRPRIKTGDVLDGRYLLQETLGEGGVATVLRALQFRIGRAVAIKLLKVDAVGDLSLRPRFEREALALAALSHPNIVRLQDYGISSGTQYLVMEHVDGRTLREVIDQDGPLPVTRALAITRQLAHALAYAHEQNIVHRDLKPLNVLVQSLPYQPEHVKVLDFGFAKFLPGSQLEPGAPVTQAGIAFGSPAYISPEQCTGDAIDGRADLYAVGVLLFEMLTGKPPFEGEISELLRQHLQSPPPRLTDRRPELAARADVQALVDKLLQKSRAQRFANAAELIGALDALEGKRPSASALVREAAREQAEHAYARWQPTAARALVHARGALRSTRSTLQLTARYLIFLAQVGYDVVTRWLVPFAQRSFACAKAWVAERVRKRGA